MRLYLSKIWLATAALALTACSDGALLSGGSKDDTKSATDDEDDAADEPVPVSGSFLTCERTEAQKTEPGETTMIGCAVIDKNGKAFPRQGYDFQLALFVDDKQKSMITADPPASSEFHRTAQLPSEYNETGYLEMTAKKDGKQIGSWQLDTIDIVSAGELGQPGASSIIEGETPLSSLKSVTRDGLWNGGIGGWVGGFVIDNNFCNSGVVRKNIGQSYVDLIEKNGYDDVGTSIDPTPVTTNLKAAPGEPNTCFLQFNMNFKGDDWAHESKDKKCMFLRSGHQLYIFSKITAKDSNFTLENLKKFAEAKKCVSP